MTGTDAGVGKTISWPDNLVRTLILIASSSAHFAADRSKRRHDHPDIGIGQGEDFGALRRDRRHALARPRPVRRPAKGAAFAACATKTRKS